MQNIQKEIIQIQLQHSKVIEKLIHYYQFKEKKENKTNKEETQNQENRETTNKSIETSSSLPSKDIIDKSQKQQQIIDNDEDVFVSSPPADKKL